MMMMVMAKEEKKEQETFDMGLACPFSPLRQKHERIVSSE